MNNLVFVPNSSFSFKQVDTLRPEDKLGWMEESTQNEIRTQVIRLENELKAQLARLSTQESKASTSQQELKKLLNQQIQMQQDYLRKLDGLHDRLHDLQHERARKLRRLTTVYI
jgi:thiamine monophosphate synthase